MTPCLNFFFYNLIFDSFYWIDKREKKCKTCAFPIEQSKVNKLK